MARYLPSLRRPKAQHLIHLPAPVAEVHALEHLARQGMHFIGGARREFERRVGDLAAAAHADAVTLADGGHPSALLETVEAQMGDLGRIAGFAAGNFARGALSGWEAAGAQARRDNETRAITAGDQAEME